jgi:cobalt-zinc-cadmium efflux system protein
MVHLKKHLIDSADRALGVSLVINFMLAVIQIIAGLYSGSVALIADALHTLSDAAGLLIALIARIVGRKPPDAIKTFGYKRIELIAALINLTIMILIGITLCLEAIERYFFPQEINGQIVIIAAVISLVINLITAILIHSFSKDNLNIRAAFLHNVSDALGSFAVLAAGVLIYLYQLNIFDVLITLLIAGYIIYQGIKDFPKVVDILIGAKPKGIVLEDLINELEKMPGILNVHHVHVWQLDEVKNALEAHVIIEDLEIMEKIKVELKKLLKEKYDIEHSTLEFERHLNHCKDKIC